MPRDYSPFTPGTPVSVELFAGRQDQIREMESMMMFYYLKVFANLPKNSLQ